MRLRITGIFTDFLLHFLIYFMIHGLVFRPLSPRLEMKMYLIWNKYQSFTPIAERFLKQMHYVNCCYFI